MPRISHFVENTTVLGPGNRFAIWFQGCSKSCNGCINPQGQDVNGGYFISNNELLEKVKLQKSITGVTISGGEPFLQFEELFDLMKSIKENTSLDIMLYSGYKYQELVSKYDEYKDKFFSLIDILIDGEYRENENTNSLYRGSDNQKIYFLSEKYKKFEEVIYKSKNRSIEFNMTKDNEIFLVGVPPKGFYEEFIEKIRR